MTLARMTLAPMTACGPDDPGADGLGAASRRAGHVARRGRAGVGARATPADVPSWWRPTGRLKRRSIGHR